MDKNQIQTDLGIISFHYNVVASLVRSAALSYFTAEHQSKGENAFLELLDEDKFFRGVRITELEPSGIDIDLYVRMLYGAAVPQTMPALHASLRKNIAQFADLNVREINVHVEKIRLAVGEQTSIVQ